MKLGGSIRRRRTGGRKPSSRKKKGGGSSQLDTVTAGPFLKWFLALALAGFGGGYLISTQILYPAPPPPGDLARVPDLSGEDMEGARARLAEEGLFLGGMETFRHPTILEGRVLGQSPLPGQLALVGDSIRVGLSLGPEMRPVPDVMRLQADGAKTVLEASGFEVVVDSVESGTPRGTVVDMSPEAGTEATIPEEIILTVSNGPPMIEMPLLLGLEEEQATSILDSLGLVVAEVETRFRFGRDQGLVVEQEPPAATLMERGSAVRLVVGRRRR